MARAFRIELLSAAAAADAFLVSALTGLINDVYAEAERGLWRDGATRTTEEEVASLARAGEIAVVAADGPAGSVLGCVRIRRLGAGMSEFGMLAVAASHRGTGMGTELVRFAEATARRAGHATMQLELLVPREWQHPSKEFLAQWYTRIGYTVFRTGSVDEFYPQLTPLLATPCDFVVYRKDFGDAGLTPLATRLTHCVQVCRSNRANLPSDRPTDTQSARDGAKVAGGSGKTGRPRRG